MHRTTTTLFLFLICAVLFASANTYSQTGTVSGIVSMPDSSDPSGTYVTIIGQNKTAITNVSGSFTLNNVTAGTLTIKAGKLGYTNAVAETLLSGGQTITLNFQLGTAVRDTQEIIQTSLFKTAIANEGNIGAVNKFIDSNGTGFQWQNIQQLREASLMIGTDSTHVSDAARFLLGLAQDNLDHDFQSLSDVIVRTDGPDSTILMTSFDDSRSSIPPGIPSQSLGVSIVQESYAFPDTGNNSALLVKLTITNNSFVTLNNFLVGYFVDWNIQPSPDSNRGDGIKVQNQIAGINSGNPFISEIAIQRNATAGTQFMAVVPLSQRQFKSARIMSVTQEVAPTGRNSGLTEEKKYIYMRDRRAVNTETDFGVGEDLAMIVSVGGLSDTSFSSNSFTIPPSSSITAGFAFVGGNDSIACINAALNAQKKWVELGNQMLVITDVAEPRANIPVKYHLEQNFPNPFNPTTNFEFRIVNGGFVRMTVFNVLGQEVAMLVNEMKQPGAYHVTWDASGYPGGVYFYRLQTSHFTETKKLVLMK